MKTLEKPEDLLKLSEVQALYLPTLSTESIERMCRRGVFKTACKPGGTRHSHWRIQRAEVQTHTYRQNNIFHSAAL